jgi:hypothetical protein
LIFALVVNITAAINLCAGNIFFSIYKSLS